MHQLRYAQEVKPWAEVPLPDLPELKPAELGLAKQIIQQIAHETFEPQKYKDEVQARMMRADRQEGRRPGDHGHARGADRQGHRPHGSAQGVARHVEGRGSQGRCGRRDEGRGSAGEEEGERRQEEVNAGAAGCHRLRRAAAALIVGQPLEGIRLASPFVLRTVTPSPKDLVGAQGRGRRAPRQADRSGDGGRALHRHSPDDRGAAALEGAEGEKLPGKLGARRRSTSRTGRWSSPRRAPRSARRCTSCRARRRSRSSIAAASMSIAATARAVRRAAAQRAPHGEARADRSDAVRRHRQRVLRRDPARREAVAVSHDDVDRRTRDRAAARGGEGAADALDRAACATRSATAFPTR